MFGIGGFELFLILLFGFLVFGPDKLPAMAKTLGKAIAKFRSAQEEMNKVIKTEVYDPNSDEPFKNPLEVLSQVGAETKKEEKTESFSERKARYDKERAAKKAAEEAKAAEAKAAAEAAAADGESAAAGAAAGAVAAGAKAADAKTTASEAEKPAAKPKPTAEELYGTKKATKPAAKPAAEEAKPAAKPAAEKAADSASSDSASAATTATETEKGE